MMNKHDTRITGFTGTRWGMTESQKLTVSRLLGLFSCMRHGDCLGADNQAHNIARELGLYIIAHPPLNDEFRAFCGGDEIMPQKEYLARNRDIVNLSSVLIATPKMFSEETSGGTWYTINYARKQNKRIFIVWPSGLVLSE